MPARRAGFREKTTTSTCPVPQISRYTFTRYIPDMYTRDSHCKFYLHVQSTGTYTAVHRRQAKTACVRSGRWQPLAQHYRRNSLLVRPAWQRLRAPREQRRLCTPLTTSGTFVQKNTPNTELYRSGVLSRYRITYEGRASVGVHTNHTRPN